MVRKAASTTMFLTILEGLVGAVLVKKHLVTNDASGFRLVVMGFHVTSTFMLLGSIAVSALAASDIRPVRFKGPIGLGECRSIIRAQLCS